MPPRRHATISRDGKYRYRLGRQWGASSPMTFVMLNPSTADAEKDDPTIRRCMGFARREQCGGIIVVNLFPLRVTRPVHLFDGTVGDADNGDNLRYVSQAVWTAQDEGAPVVAAWGAFKSPSRSAAWRWIARRQGSILCLGKTADGSPRHPLYVRADAPLEVWP